MTPEQFCYWLQGALELGTADSLDAGQVDMIREHLALVFAKVTPESLISARPDPKRGVDDPDAFREKLDAQKAVDELVRKGLMQRGVPTRNPDIMPIPATIAPTVPRWPDETMYDPVKCDVIDMTKVQSFC